MQLRYLKEDAYDRLYSSVEAHLEWYCTPGLAVEYLGLTESEYETSSVDLQRFTPIQIDDGADDDAKNDNDLSNIRMVYSTWRALNPTQASNKYLWTYYCHCEPSYVDYIRHRWMSGSFTVEQVKNVFFVTGNKRNMVRGNALSSLWWKGYLTYDDSADDPFWITRTLGSTTNLADFLDTFNSYSRTRTHGIARAISEVIEELGMERLKNQPFRDLNKYLNRYSAVTPLDFFSEDEIYELAKEEFMRICT